MLKQFNASYIGSLLSKTKGNVIPGVAISTAIHRLASLDLASSELQAVVSGREFLSLVNAIPRNTSSLAIRNVSNILWGFAKMQYHPSGELMACVCDLFQKNIQKAVRVETLDWRVEMSLSLELTLD